MRFPRYILFLLLFSTSFFVYAQQDNFYGKWVGHITIKEGEKLSIVNTITITITVSNFISTIEAHGNETLMYPETVNAEVIRWRELTDEDIACVLTGIDTAIMEIF